MINVPTWLAVLAGVAAGLTALATVWKLLIAPLAELIVLLKKALPLLRELTEEFSETPKPFDVLGEIVAEFRTDSGSSLRDVVDRLEAAVSGNAYAAEVLKVQVEASRQLAIQDREQLARLLIHLDRLDIKVQQSSEQGDRIEANATLVAVELEASQHRADRAHGEAGEAADAASRSSTKENR